MGLQTEANLTLYTRQVGANPNPSPNPNQVMEALRGAGRAVVLDARVRARVRAA